MIYFNLLECCSITKGAQRSCIFDLERNTYCLVPNELYRILNRGYLKDNELQFKEYIDFLEIEGFIHCTKDKSNKSITKNKYYSAFKFDDIIVDISNIENFNDIIEKIDSTEVEALQLRFFLDVKIEELIIVLNTLAAKSFISVEIILNHHSQNKKIDYEKIYDSFRCVSKIVVMGCLIQNNLNNKNIFFIGKKLKSKHQCGLIDEQLFNVNIREWLNSKEHNTCLYQKISIDSDGEIKIVPLCPKVLET